MQRFGRDTVTFRTFTAGARDNKGIAAKVPVNVDVAGCWMQPTSVTETVTETDVATAVWHCIAPPVAAATGMDPTGELTFNGNTYQVTGIKPYTGLRGLVHHVTVICKRQIG